MRQNNKISRVQTRRANQNAKQIHKQSARNAGLENTSVGRINNVDESDFSFLCDRNTSITRAARLTRAFYIFSPLFAVIVLTTQQHLTSTLVR